MVSQAAPFHAFACNSSQLLAQAALALSERPVRKKGSIAYVTVNRPRYSRAQHTDLDRSADRIRGRKGRRFPCTA